MKKTETWVWENEKTLGADGQYVSPEVYYSCQNWKSKGFNYLLDVSRAFEKNASYLEQNQYKVVAYDLSDKCSNYFAEIVDKPKVNHKKIFDDLFHLPYEDNKFDCILATDTLKNTDIDVFNKILLEFKRILKPDGEVYFNIESKESIVFKGPNLSDKHIKARVEPGPYRGCPIFYIDDNDCKCLFNEFKIVQIKNVRKLSQSGKFYGYYHIWLKK